MSSGAAFMRTRSNTPGTSAKFYSQSRQTDSVGRSPRKKPNRNEPSATIIPPRPPARSASAGWWSMENSANARKGSNEMLEKPYHRDLLTPILRLWNALPMRYGVIPEDARAAAYKILIETSRNESHMLVVANRLAEGEFFPTPFSIREISAEEDREAIPAPSYEAPPPPTPEEQAEIDALIAEVNEKIRDKAKRSRMPDAAGIEPQWLKTWRKINTDQTEDQSARMQKLNEQIQILHKRRVENGEV